MIRNVLLQAALLTFFKA